MRRAAVVPVLALVLVVLPAALLAACGEESGGAASGDDPATAAAPSTDDLDGTFTSTAVQGRELVRRTQVTLHFEDGRMAVRAGCNTMSAAYEVDDAGTLRWTDAPVSTMKGCPSALAAQDRWLSDLLFDGVAATLDGDALTLSGDAAGEEVVIDLERG
ncbi:META domain-containing protein [Nocardioides sp. YIM 152588]|uniref:META domain-containing protein n=1 Tax=Nocardioides sp. YIM 152588 TaxID=3158259 RepID=UPI0032E51CF1